MRPEKEILQDLAKGWKTLKAQQAMITKLQEELKRDHKPDAVLTTWDNSPKTAAPQVEVDKDTDARVRKILETKKMVEKIVKTDYPEYQNPASIGQILGLLLVEKQ